MCADVWVMRNIYIVFNHRHGQDNVWFCPPQSSFNPSINPRYWGIFCLKSFGFSRNSHKWNYTMYSIQYTVWVFLHSLSIMHLWFIHFILCISSRFLFYCWILFCLLRNHSLFGLLLVGEYLGGFQFEEIMYKTIINRCVQKLHEHHFSLLQEKPRSKADG